MKTRIAIVVCVLLATFAFAASEIVANLTLKVTKGGIVYVNESVANNLTLNTAAPNVSRYTTTASTNATGTALDVSLLTTNGVCWLQNCSTNNFVDVGVQDATTNFLPLIRLKAGEAWPIRITPGVTPYARANTAAVVLKQPIIDD
jgi:hypothetical protein